MAARKLPTKRSRKEPLERVLVRPCKPTQTSTNNDSRAWNISSISRTLRDGDSSDRDRGS